MIFLQFHMEAITVSAYIGQQACSIAINGDNSLSIRIEVKASRAVP